jgi:hypothetical protein
VKRASLQKLILVLALAYAALWVFENAPDLLQPPASQSTGAEDQLATAFRNQQSDLQVRGSGVVVSLLADDNQGSRHQRFILELSSGQTLLVSHNIDLAPRINALRKGDSVEFYGEYEWNDRGGVIHWTHHDPAGRHPDGWLKHEGTTYQ